MSEFQKVGNQELLRKNWDAVFNAKPKQPDPENLDPNKVLEKYYEDFFKSCKGSDATD